MITRRIAVAAGGIGLLAASLRVFAQPRSRAARVGFLWFSSMDDSASLRYRAAFRQRLRELGYVEGSNIVIAERSADSHPERLNDLARELVASKVDVLVSAAVAATSAARQATKTIPIVMVNAGDPVSAGLIASLARPGGNVTGSTNLSFGAKQVELMHELIPPATKFAILLNPSNAGASRYVADATEAARILNLKGANPAELPVEQPTRFELIINLKTAKALGLTMPPLLLQRADEVIQ